MKKTTLPQKIKNYLANPNLKKVGVTLSLTEEEVLEYAKCRKNPIYFIEKYVKIVTLDKGFVQIELYPFQKQAVKDINDNRMVIVKAGRQIGKTTLIVGYILWYILFNEDQVVAILANKAPTAREILNRIKIAYEALPLWLQQGVKVWNKGDIELENKCRVMATSTASSAIRGYSISLLYLDEFAFVPTNIAEEFFTSVYPTISSGTKSKVLISSTPNGMNHFYRMWTESVSGKNGFVNIEANWRQIPGRDQAWAEEQRRVLGEDKYLQEIECEFLGSSGTLISSGALKNLAFKHPIHATDSGIKIYELPEKGRTYFGVVDTSRGKGLDYSAITIIDTTELPYKLVATFKDNNISPLVFPTIVKKIGEYFNNAYILVEVNDIGQQVSDLLFDDYEYENILCTEEVKSKTVLTWSNSGRVTRGIRTTKRIKRLGCNFLKSLVESSRLLIQDFETISELSTFIAKGNSYEADAGYHDDLVMCLVLFSWASTQEMFSDLNKSGGLKKHMYNQQVQQIEQESLPMPIFSNGDANYDFVEDGSVWNVVDTRH
jgi:hypothetical protein